MKRGLTSIAVFVLLQVAIVFTSHAAPPAGGGGWDGGGGGCDTYHIVQYGETLFSIGRRYGVNPHHIANVNGLYNPDHIYVGQKLHIPCSDGYKPDRGSGPYHKPKYGYYPYPSVAYGYDFTGYYYETYYPYYRRYSYTCGYHFNCY